ncbi:MAG: hypothetical protein JO261_00260 [Alphaproteobacteria bacterium]|nr:hypothetical protein [Alphaproteobacteria bacterium]MBV9692106.1 hypothetical protein [Alphaproteobacteria bacterium]
MLWGFLPDAAHADPNYDPANRLQAGVYNSVLKLWAPDGNAAAPLVNLATGFGVIAQAKADYRAFAAQHQNDALAAAVKATADAFDAAFAAVDVYFYKPIPELVPEGYARIGDTAGLAKLGVADAKLLADDSSGFYSTIYAKGAVGAPGTKYLFSCRGTDDGFCSVTLDHGLKMSPDGFADFGQNFGLKSSQYEEALEVGRRVASAVDATKGTVIFTGHSLGGGLASAQALATSKRAYVFNPSGVAAKTVDGKTAGANNEITVYVYRGNWLDKLQADGLGVRPLGKTIAIDHLHTAPGAAYDNPSDWHLLNFVIPGMLAMLRSGRLAA